MWGLLIVLLVVVGIAVVAAAILALGTLLAHLFAVTTFEASVVVLVVAAAWVLLLRTSPLDAAAGEPGDMEDEEEPAIIFQAVPVPTRRAPRKRKR